MMGREISKREEEVLWSILLLLKLPQNGAFRLAACNLCNNDRIKGAVRFGPVWRIPTTAVLPNARRKENAEPTLPMPRKSPFLDMTNLYNTAGEADKAAEMLENNPEAHALFVRRSPTVAVRSTRFMIKRAIFCRLVRAFMLFWVAVCCWRFALSGAAILDYGTRQSITSLKHPTAPRKSARSSLFLLLLSIARFMITRTSRMVHNRQF